MRCTSRAIEFKAGKGEFTWSYDPGQCTFCGRCVEGCTEHALKEGHASMRSPSRIRHLCTSSGELKKSYTVARKPPAPKPPAASVRRLQTGGPASTPPEAPQ